MRKVLAVVVVPVILVVLAACQPTPATVTAVPSTLKPACKSITTLTGKVSPAGASKEITIQYQRPSDGKWIGFKWFETGAPDEGWHIITAPVSKTTGNYSVTYYAPNQVLPVTIRLRVWARDLNTKTDIVSKSWYVTRQTTCP